MNKFKLIAFLPFAFQIILCGTDFKTELHKKIMPYLITARKTTGNVKVELKLDPILKDLHSYAGNGFNQKNQAIFLLTVIIKALENYKESQYSGVWSKWFGKTPDNVKNEIQPAIDKVKAALSILSANNTGLIVGGAIAGSAALIAAAAALYLNAQQEADDDLFNIANQADIDHRSQQRRRNRNGEFNEQRNNPFN